MMNTILIAKVFSALVSLAAPVKDTSGKTDTAVKTNTASAHDKTHLNLGVTYNSTMNYYGRTDSLKSSGIYPFVGIFLQGGLYANATFIFIQNSQRREYGATVVEGGYNFDSKNRHWAGNLSATKYYYQGNTDLVQSVIKGMAAASLTNLNKIVNITLEADARFSDQVDAGLQGGLDHTTRFRRLFSRSDVLVMDPTVIVYAGTQHFSQSFLEQQQFLFLPAGEQALTKNSRIFSVLAYEGSMPIVYAYKGFNLILDPAYIVPEKVLSSSGQGRTEGASFYVTVTFKVSL